MSLLGRGAPQKGSAPVAVEGKRTQGGGCAAGQRKNLVDDLEKRNREETALAGENNPLKRVRC